MAQVIFNNQKSDGIGTVLTTGASMAPYVLTLNGTLDGALCTVIADINGGTNYVTVGSLSAIGATSLLMLPGASKVTCRLNGAGANTNVTVMMGS